jgi:hypothetical protein
MLTTAADFCYTRFLGILAVFAAVLFVTINHTIASCVFTLSLLVSHRRSASHGSENSFCILELRGAMVKQM